MAEHRRLNTFDFLRLLAATIVVIGHAGRYLGHSFLHPIGDIDGVGMFFVMSGMLVYRSGERSIETTGSWRDYFRNRYLRIAPAIYTYVIVASLVVLAIGAVTVSAFESAKVAAWILGALVLVPDYHPPAFAHFGTGILDGSLWSIPAEVSFYLLVPILYYTARRVGFVRMIGTVAVVAVVAVVVDIHLPSGAQNVVHHTFFERLAYFGAGVFWARYWPRTPQKWWLFLIAVAAWAAITVLEQNRINPLLWPLLLAIPLSYATVFFGYHGPVFLARLPRYIGDLSFGTYIWHMPIVNFFVWKGWHGGWCTPVVIVVAWLFAAASWWLVERRALMLKRVSERYAETGVKIAA